MKSSVLRNPDFVRLWLAQALSQTAQNAVFYALLVYVEERTSSSFQMGLLVLSTILPFVFFGVAAGVLVDLWPKKYVLAISNAVRVPIVLMYIFLFDVSFDASLIAVYALNFLFTMVSQFFAPAEAAAIPLVVRRDQLLQANGLFNLMLVVSQLIGFVLIGPPLLKIFGSTGFFIVAALTYVVATVLVVTIPLREETIQRTESTDIRRLEADMLERIVDEVKAGWRLIRSDAGIALAMIELTLTQNITLATGMIAPGFVSRVLHVPAEDAVYVLAPAGVGILLGTIVVPRMEHRISRDRMVLTGLAGLGATFLLLAAAPPVYDWLAGLLFPNVSPTEQGYIIGLVAITMLITNVMGWAFAMVVVPAQTVLQVRAPVHMRARIFAVQFTFANVISIVPLVFLGVLADLIGIPRVLALIGVIVLAVWHYAASRSHDVDSVPLLEQPAGKTSS